MLSQNGKVVATVLGIYMLAKGGRAALNIHQVNRMLDEQNVDEKLARRLLLEFRAQHRLTTKVKDMDMAPGYHVDTDTVVGRKSKSAKGRLSVDDPAWLLHELGHAKHRGSWHDRLYNAPRITSKLSLVAALFGRPVIAATLRAVGYAPQLINEWKASQTANEFVRRTLPPEEAERVRRVLNAAYQTYLTMVGAKAAESAAIGWGAMKLMKSAGMSGAHYAFERHHLRPTRPAAQKTLRLALNSIVKGFKDAAGKTYEIPDYEPRKRKRDRERRSARKEGEER